MISKLDQRNDNNYNPERHKECLTVVHVVDSVSGIKQKHFQLAQCVSFVDQSHCANLATNVHPAADLPPVGAGSINFGHNGPV